MPKYAVDIVRSEVATVVVEAENRYEAIDKAYQTAIHVPEDKWFPTEEYSAACYLSEDEWIEEGYDSFYEDGIGYLSAKL